MAKGREHSDCSPEPQRRLCYVVSARNDVRANSCFM